MLNSDDRELAITHDNEIAYVLSKFNEDFIYNTVEEALELKLRHYQFIMPNIVEGYENTFKQILNEYPSATDQITVTRTDVYSNILKILCDYYRLEYNDYDQYDLYTCVAYMYNLLVSGFQHCICNFFFNFIIKEKDGIYKSFNLSEKKKNKDVSTFYAKKTFADSRIGVISSNLEYVIKSICAGIDISFEQYLDFAIGMGPYKEAAELLKIVLKPQVDFVKTFIAPIFDTEYGIGIITNIKIELQKYSSNSNDINYFIGGNGNDE